MILTRRVLDALRLAAERDDGQCYQGWMTKEEFAACAAEGYVQRDFVHGSDARAQMAERLRAHIRAATQALLTGEPDDWHLAREHLRSATNLEEEFGRRC